MRVIWLLRRQRSIGFFCVTENVIRRSDPAEPLGVQHCPLILMGIFGLIVATRTIVSEFSWRFLQPQRLRPTFPDPLLASDFMNRYVPIRRLPALSMLAYALVVVWSTTAAGQTSVLPAVENLAASPEREPLFEPLFERVVTDAADGRLDEFPLLGAALIFSGETSSEKLAQFQDRCDQLTDRFALRVTGMESAEAIAKTALRFIKQEILRGEYDPMCCDLRESLQGGSHNCLMSTLLFVSLARSAGLEAHAVAQPGHVKAFIVVDQAKDNAYLDVETTRADGVKKSLNRDAGRKLNDVHLMAKILYNRGLCELAQRHFDQSLALTELSSQLDPQHQPAVENTQAVINNWALHLSNQGRYRESLRLIQGAGDVRIDRTLLRLNERHIYARWISDLKQSGRTQQLQQVMAAAARVSTGDHQPSTDRDGNSHEQTDGIAAPAAR